MFGVSTNHGYIVNYLLVLFTNKGGKMCFLIKNTNQKLASGARVENTRAIIEKNTNKGDKNLPFNIKKGAV